MIKFEQFVKSLGDHAGHYTPEQLERLHVDVQRFAQVIIAIYRVKEKRQSGRSPQPRLDGACPDRTLNKENNSP
jgi:hypothetical protein